MRPVPPPRDHLRIEKDGRLVNRAQAPQVPDRRHGQQQLGDAAVPIAQIMAPTNEQLDSIKKYQVSTASAHERGGYVSQNDIHSRSS